MPVEEHPQQAFCEVICHVLGQGHPFQENQVLLHLVRECKELNVHVTGACGGFASISHSGTAIIVLIDDRCSLLGDVEVVDDTADVEEDLGKVIGSHKFIFSQGASNCELEFGFVANCASCQPGTDTGNQASFQRTCCPV